MNLKTTTKNPLPKHIAIIMDGNGRWAEERGLNRTAGHKEGAETVRKVTIHCAKADIKYLTLYAFSTENWSRPKLEVEYIMKLLDSYLKKELDFFLENNVRFKVIGDITKFSKKLQETILYTIERTKNCSGLTQILALNYGSKDEILRAVKKLQEENLEVNEENFDKCLDTKDIPNVDILIRTSGEVRLSNFLLWQVAYAEMFFTQTYWPDFNEIELDDIISDYMNRERRFGGV